MSRIIQFAAFAPLGLLLLLANTGCNKSTTVDAATLDKHRTRLALAEEPEGVQTVAAVRVALLGEEHDPHADHDHASPGHEDHEGHDHDSDGHQDHGTEDHHAEHAHDDHDHDHDTGHDGHTGHDHDGHDEHAHDDHEGHDHDEHAHDGHDHDDHGHAHTSEPLEVSVVGHIGGLANPWGNTEYPFAKTEAVFFLADPQAIVENEASGHSHAPGEECAYCLAHAADQADMLAMVRFVDKNGDVLPMDARQLFDVKEKDMVVVCGKARVTPSGILVIDAQGLYIRE